MAKHEDSKLSKLKHFLGIGGGKQGNVPVGSVSPQRREFVFTPELIKDISPNSPPNHRAKNIKELCEIVQTRKLEENAVEVLWINIQDLLLAQHPDSRHLALKFLQCAVRGQYDSLGIMRAQFFRVLKNHTVLEDLHQRLELFKELSKSGKDLEYFEEETGEFLLDWMKGMFGSGNIIDYLELLVNIIKYNAAYLDEEVIKGIVLHCCIIAAKSKSEDEIEFCLKVLDAVVCYSYLPSASLYHSIVSLCQVVNHPKFCQRSWDLMRKLLGTHLGHRGIHTMCTILQDKNHTTESGAMMLRGAIFFIGMALWGSKRVTTLKHPPAAVLPSFLMALQHTDSDVVAYEIVLSLLRVVQKYGKELHSVVWDIIMDLTEAVFKHIENSPTKHSLLVKNTHEFLTLIESKCEEPNFYTPKERFFKIIETWSHKRPESSILVLVTYKAQCIEPTTEGWIQAMYHLMEKYFRLEARSQVRIKVLDILSKVLQTNLLLYEDELIESVVMPHLAHIENDHDPEVKKRSALLLIELANTCQTLNCTDMLEILKKIISKIGQVPVSPGGQEARIVEDSGTFVGTAVLGLVDTFKKKLHHLPSTLALSTYDILVNHLQRHYQEEGLKAKGGNYRRWILECFLDIRGDGKYRMGLAGDVFSPYVVCSFKGEIVEKSNVVGTGTPPVSCQSPINQNKTTIIPYADAFKCIRICLEEDPDWSVLKVVLEKLPFVMKCKTLMLCAHAEDIERFCTRLCAMVSNRSLGLPEKFYNRPEKLTRSDFHSHIFPVLACLASYHDLLDRPRQTDLVRCLEFGLVSKCATICIHALTLCALEMQDVIMRQLPSVLLKLSQISATVAMAIPLMEFLSSLMRMPQLYANFVEEQYMSIFAIALPYTNPFKYSHYTVSLAYHVIAMWFLKCKLAFRKKFVTFIVKGLKANVLRQFEETANARARLNTDSADREKTHSLSSASEDIRRKAQKAKLAVAEKRKGQSGSNLNHPPPVFAQDDAMFQFHRELTETCTDMLARYSFLSCASMPRRSPVAEFLLSNAQSRSWLLGNKLITISTSGGAKVVNRGLCEKCLGLVKVVTRDSASETEPSAAEQIGGGGRKRHRSAAVRSMSETVALKPLSQDDILLHKGPGTSSSREEKSDTNLLSQNSQESLVSLNGGSQSSMDEMTKEMNSSSDSGKKAVTFATTTEKMQALDTVLMGLKSRSSDKTIFSSNVCNCWCTLWAEILIRSPTGNVSWMMRIQNEQDLAGVFAEFPLADISNLFISKPDTGEDSDTTSRKFEHMTRKKIDSMCLGEVDYDVLLEEHFENPESSDTGSNGTVGRDEDRSETASMHTMASAQSGVAEPGGDELDADDIDPRRIRKSSSSPDIHTQYTLEIGGDKVTEFKPKLAAAPHLDNSLEKPRPDKDLHPSPGSKSSRDMKSFPSTPTPASAATSTDTSPKSEPQSNETTPDSKTSDRSRGSYVSSIRRPSEDSTDTAKSSLTGPSSSAGKEGAHAGISPSFLFLQLFHGNFFGSNSDNRPIQLPANTATERSIKVLDFIFPYETHKIGVLYVGPGQANDEKAVLANVYGSSRYTSFLQGLGHLIKLRDCDNTAVYVGGLNLDGGDGDFAYTWHDDFMQVIYHVATLMPKKENDPNSNAKKLHLGNDYVTIVYNQSGEDWKMGSIKGQFNYVHVVINPLDHGCNAVTVQTKDDIVEVIGHTDTKIISDACLASLVRQMAVHANLASVILQRQKTNPKDPYASNWLERLRQIRRISSKAQQENKTKDKGGVQFNSEDFTDYV